MTDRGRYSFQPSELHATDDVRSPARDNSSLPPTSSSRESQSGGFSKRPKSPEIRAALDSLEGNIQHELGEMRDLMAQLLVQAEEYALNEDLRRNISHAYLRLSNVDMELKSGLDLISHEISLLTSPFETVRKSLRGESPKNVNTELTKYLRDLKSPR
ncbi:MAG: hypothetical protein GY854_04840 [Deltaproteobacteria bacterium]|nr:hypothetical protein [Deltaproteobacteria bacterium]